MKKNIFSSPSLPSLPPTDSQIISCYARHGNTQLVSMILHVSYKRIKQVLDDAGIKRKSGWKRVSWTIKPERRNRYGKDAEDEGSESREGGSESIQPLPWEEVE